MSTPPVEAPSASGSPPLAPPDPAPAGAATTWLKWLLLATLALPALLFAVASWNNYEAAYREAERELAQRAEIGDEHAAKVFDTHKLVILRTEDLIRGLDDAAIAGIEPALHAALAQMLRDLPQVQNIFIVGRDGRALVSATTSPLPPLDVANREPFMAARDRSARYGISRLEQGTLNRRPFFGVVARRTDQAGNFAGIVMVSVAPQFFIEFYTTLMGESGDIATLLRADGEVLARGPTPATRALRLPEGHPFFAAIAAGADHGAFRAASLDTPQVERLYAYHRVVGYPAYVIVSRSVSTITAAWQHAMATHLLFGIPATLGLFLLTLTALRRTRREAQALEHARDEMRRREAAEADISAQRRIEASLRESEERLGMILDSLPHIAFVQQPDGTATYHSRAFYDYVGPAARNDVASRLGFHHPDDVPSVVAIREKARAAGVEYMYEARLRRHDGAYRWHVVNCRPLRRNGEIIAWLGSAVDMHDMHTANELLETRVSARTAELATANERLLREMAERQAAERQLRQSEKLTAIGQLTGGVAHDFNNVLTAVLGNLELAEKRVTDDQARRMVQAAARAAQRGARLTEQLLAYARQQRLMPQATDLNQMFGGEMIDMLRRTLGGNVSIDTVLAQSLWPALADATQIELVVLNLVINARDAMPFGGHIVISTANVPAGDPALPPDLPRRDYVMVSVADTGTGMPDDVAARAFEPFFTTKEPGKGSGLGLSQVYGVAQQLGGGVQLKTVLGQGTTIEVYLPRTEARAAPAPAERRPAVAAHGQATILVVDDEDDVREVAVAHLEALGYRVIAATNGPAALEILSSDKTIDLLLADYAMPGISGADLARVALATRPGLAVVIVTGYADIAKLDQQLAGVAVVRKPYRQQELADKVDGALAQAALARLAPENVVRLNRAGE